MEKITIGVYHAFRPRTAQNDERMEAMLKESKRQNIDLIFYNNEGISFENKTIEGYIYDHGNWKKVRSLIPEVTINLLGEDSKDKTRTESLLEKITEFTSVLVLNKYGVYKKLIKSEEYKKYAIKSEQVEDYRDVLDFIDRYGRVVFKPIGGRQGQNIYFIYREKDRFILLKDNKKVFMNLEEFKYFIYSKTKKESYLIQQYIECLTKNGEPYDFRMHVHRDRTGKFKVIFWHPRVGEKNTIITSLSQGGCMPDNTKFLMDEFGDRYKEVERDLNLISLQLAEYIQSFSNKEINEIGVDLAIDSDGNYYTYELNGGPNSRYHQDIRMKYVMEYARYRYERHIEDKLDKDLKYISAEFLKIEKKLMLGDLDNEKYIGLLTYSNSRQEKNFVDAANQIALEKDINLFTFYGGDVDKDEKSISGVYYENGAYKTRKFAYPDLIIDRLSLRSKEGARDLYEELDKLSFDHRIEDLDYLKVDKLIKDKKLEKLLLSWTEINSFEDILNFLDRYGACVLTAPSKDLNYKSYIFKKSNKYEFIDIKDKEIYSKSELEERLEEDIEDLTKIIVKEIKLSEYRDGRNFSIIVNMVKGSGGEWKITRKYAKVGGKNQLVLDSRYGGYMGDLDRVLSYKFANNISIVDKKIDSLSLNISEEIDRNIEGSINEASYEFVLSQAGEIKLTDIDILTPNIKFIEYETARQLLSYAEYLLDKQNKK